MNEKLFCGAAKECITPPEALLPGLYGLMCQGFGGILDDLYIRAAAVKCGEDALLLISFELDKAPYPREWTAEIAARFGIPEENILYSAVHTHTAPLTCPRPNDGPNARMKKTPEQQAATDAYEAQVHAALLRVCDRAFASMQPARFGFTSGESYISTNRNYDYTDCTTTGFHATGDADRTLFLAGFEAEDGTPIAYLLNYAMHCCVLHRNRMFGGKLAVSPDFAGSISRQMEKDCPGSVVLWTSGAAGDVNPILMNEMYYPDAGNGNYCAEQLSGDETLFLRVVTGWHCADVRRTLEKLDCTQETLKLAANAQIVRTPGRDGDYELRVHGLRLGEVLLCGFSGELYTSFGRQVKALSPFPATVIVNHDASFWCNSGYILDDEGIEKDTLGNDHSNLQPGYLRDALDRELPPLLHSLYER